MFTHSDLFLDLAKSRHQEMVAAADHSRLVKAARHGRHEAAAAAKSASGGGASVKTNIGQDQQRGGTGPGAVIVGAAIAGTLAKWGRHVGGSAR